ncbi:MAG: hypothetical protein AAFN08_17520 [Cyanobacteria bacterium J06559_3]
MSKVDYATMSYEELREYFLANRNNTDAFQAYMDRLRTNPKSPMIQADELENLSFNEQVQLIAQRLQERFGASLS